MNKVAKIISIAIFIFSLMPFEEIYSQGQPWVLPGNNTVTLANFVGTTNAVPLQLRTAQSQPIVFQPNGVQRMFIDPTFGRIAIGPNFSTPQVLLHLKNNSNIATNLMIENTAGIFDASVENTSGFSLLQSSQHMIFVTNNIRRMSLSSTTGNLGINLVGNNIANRKLEVRDNRPLAKLKTIS